MTRFGVRSWRAVATLPSLSTRITLLSPCRTVYPTQAQVALPYFRRGLQTQVPDPEATQPELAEKASEVLEEKVQGNPTVDVPKEEELSKKEVDEKLSGEQRRKASFSEEGQAKYRENYKPADWAAVEKLSRFQEVKGKECGFCFDIDGVLIQGTLPVPGAKEVLYRLAKHNVPSVCLTNGGGTDEGQKAWALREKLGIPSDTEVSHRLGQMSMIVSHTPFRSWSRAIKKNDIVLVTGHEAAAAKKVLRDTYHFAKVFTPREVYRAWKSIYPFSPPPAGSSDHKRSRSRPRVHIPSDPYDYSSIPDSAFKVDHILVFNDPRDWSLDVQLISDLLLSHKGYLGTLSKKNGDKTLENDGWQRDGQPKLWFSNLDLFWKTQYPINRYGTGAFVEALKGVWRATTGGVDLEYQALGKPHAAAHQTAERGLVDRAGYRRRIKRIYMIGDNPESDIRGANEFKSKEGVEWISILVRTGVWKPTEMEPEPRYKPAVIVDSVVEAVEWALEREEKEHELRRSAQAEALDEMEETEETEAAEETRATEETVVKKGTEA